MGEGTRRDDLAPVRREAGHQLDDRIFSPLATSATVIGDPIDSTPAAIWHLLTGDYPPTPGGVADYTSLLARALAAEGCEVHVYCRGDATGPEDEPSGVRVHRIAGRFGLLGLARLGRELNQTEGPRTILVQYVPHAFGFRAMNFTFVAWVAHRVRRGDEIRVMFHEVAYPWVHRPLRHNLIAAANRVMAAVLLRVCVQSYVSIPAWQILLRRLGPARVPITWIPIPSNIPTAPAQFGMNRLDSATAVVGHFGTYGTLITRLLEPIVRGLLDRRPDVRLLLLGSGGDHWRSELLVGRADWAGRIDAPGAQADTALQDRLRSCDCLVQPYPDGISSRRTTAMAALANSRPIITNLGELSEPLWNGGAVALTSFGEPARVVDFVCELLDSPSRRAELARAGRQLYENRFAISHTIAALLGRPTSHR